MIMVPPSMPWSAGAALVEAALLVGVVAPLREEIVAELLLSITTGVANVPSGPGFHEESFE